jgi:hypothetical protein
MDVGSKVHGQSKAATGAPGTDAAMAVLVCREAAPAGPSGSSGAQAVPSGPSYPSTPQINANPARRPASRSQQNRPGSLFIPSWRGIVDPHWLDWYWEHKESQQYYPATLRPERTPFGVGYLSDRDDLNNGDIVIDPAFSYPSLRYLHM